MTNTKKQTYQDLEIYQLSQRLAVLVYKMTMETLPKFEMYEVGSQIRRSSKSIVSNIVEGFGRKQYQSEYVKFLTYALASVDETKNHLQILKETDSLQDEKLFTEFFNEYEILGRKLYSFRLAVQGGPAHNKKPETCNVQPVA